MKQIPELKGSRRDMMRGVARSSHDQVARVLGTEILSGELEPGTKLAEDDMLARFEISRTVLREVNKTLKAKGFIAAKPRVGTTVLDSTHWNYFDADVLAWKVEQGLDLGFLTDLAEVRIAIGAAAARAAATRRTEEDLAAIRDSLTAMRAAGNRDAFAAADLDFRKAIARASGNALMSSLTGVIETTLTASFQMRQPAAKGDPDLLGHDELAAAIESGDGDRAARAMRTLIGEGFARGGLA
ncbi:FCD domain-containing protein [Sphingomonas sp. MG17]|uniref:FCD domain-containing protein n=1 Tax=Sphingomonas tagetis TaxID=2949092 RepID=A0A9X2KKD1_9SPHN|nr:FCD domain-containing protein [Sphingomonas tagetis]MCP3729477.1 FCD domain-containing protein [Sphingomonas tagetis]